MSDEVTLLGEKTFQARLGLKNKVLCVLQTWSTKNGLWYGFKTAGFPQLPVRDAIKREMRCMTVREYGMYNKQDLPKEHLWYFPHDEHNFFILQYLIGNNLYKHWRKPMEQLINEAADLITRPEMREHQVELFAHAWVKRHTHITGDMGLGKSLVAIELIENAIKEWDISQDEVWYVGPRSAKKSFELEIEKWKSPILLCQRMTYEALTKKAKFWVDGTKAPRVLIFDESSRLKNFKAQRTQAASHIASAMRAEYGMESIILEMSGTPSPGSPVDWFSQAHIVRPGFLVEPTAGALEGRLSVKQTEFSPLSGCSYQKLVTYLDNPEKCKHCGSFQSDHSITAPLFIEGTLDHAGEELTPFTQAHKWEPSINEVEKLYKRLNGLTLVKLSEDCLDLPPIQYKTIRVKPDPQTVQASKLVKKVCTNASQARAKMLQLSDGFNYSTTTDSMLPCELCKGSGHFLVPEAEDFDPMVAQSFEHTTWKEVEEQCPNCGGEGEVPKYERTMQQIHCPKDDVLIDQLEEHEDFGRFVVFGAFTGSLEKIQELCLQKGWVVLRMDGTGWQGFHPTSVDPLSVDELIRCMDYSHTRAQELKRLYPKVVVVANAKSASMGLTFTASPTILFYSNSYDYEARAQAEKRIHRLGGRPIPVTIIDIVHLAIDKLVKNNLDKKEDLQGMTMGRLLEELEAVERDLY